MPSAKIQLGDITADVVQKDIKNIHLSVYPPRGAVRIAAPLRMKLDTIRVFAISRLGWIRQQRKKLLEQERESPREYLDRESHYVWGRRYLLQLAEAETPPLVERRHGKLWLRVRPGASDGKKQAVLDAWLREQIHEAVPPLVAKWEPIIGVQVARLIVRRMKTKWGSCSTHDATIRLNTELAKKPRECLEYLLNEAAARGRVGGRACNAVCITHRVAGACIRYESNSNVS